MNQSHVNEPDREKLLGVNGNKASSHDTGHDDDHGHSLSWRDITESCLSPLRQEPCGF